jgi:hypothetical protein
MSVRIESPDDINEERPRYEFVLGNVGGYEADDEESDHSDSDSSSIVNDYKHSPISMAVFTTRRRRRNTLASSLVGLMSSINPRLDESKSVQFVTIIRSYCEKQADYLQLQRNFFAARCGVDDLSSDSTSSILSDTTDLSDGNHPKTTIKATTLKPKGCDLYR